MNIKIGKNNIGLNHKPFFIADIGANHNQSLDKAKKLIYLAAQSGANAVKFQHFKANSIVSDIGFKKLNKIKSHQSNWGLSVYDVYKNAEINFKWTENLKKCCSDNNLIFFSSPYSLEYIDILNNHMSAYKIGSGDITWHEAIIKIAKKNKPVLLATGASTKSDVDRAVKLIKKFNKKLILMQCNTNYTADKDNFRFINLNVLKYFKKKYKNCILGLSDHTFGHSTVLGAITLGARVIEKHFTDNNYQKGPDHKFAMNPKTWKDMVQSSNELFLSLGSGEKVVEKNEIQTVILQRRSIRASKNLIKGTILKKSDLVYLRPCPKNSLNPYQYKKLIGKKLKKNVKQYDNIFLKDLNG